MYLHGVLELSGVCIWKYYSNIYLAAVLWWISAHKPLHASSASAVRGSTEVAFLQGVTVLLDS